MNESPTPRGIKGTRERNSNSSFIRRDQFLKRFLFKETKEALFGVVIFYGLFFPHKLPLYSFEHPLDNPRPSDGGASSSPQKK